MERHEKIRAFLVSLLRQKGDLEPLQDDEPLVTSGRIDSLDVTEAIAFLETTFGVDFSQIEFDVERFDSVNAIAGMVG